MTMNATLDKMLDAINACRDDLNTFAGDEGITLLVADRLNRISAEVGVF